MISTTETGGGTVRRTRLVNALPWLWLGMSAAWAVVIFTTDQLAWPLALWVATTVGPLTAIKTRLDSQVGPPRGTEQLPASARRPTKGTKG